MMSLPPFSLPLQDQPPVGYGWEGRDFSVLSTTAEAIEQRDRFLGHMCCVVCGMASESLLKLCHIVGQEIWSDLRGRGWVPSQIKEDAQLEPRNGLLLCINHAIQFKDYDFFIRFFPDIQKFVFINYYNKCSLQEFHGKAVALDIKDYYAPFPSLFIIHEIRARGFHPLTPVNPDVLNGNHWQDWISSDGVFDDVSHSFRRNSFPCGKCHRSTTPSTAGPRCMCHIITEEKAHVGLAKTFRSIYHLAFILSLIILSGIVFVL